MHLHGLFGRGGHTDTATVAVTVTPNVEAEHGIDLGTTAPAAVVVSRDGSRIYAGSGFGNAPAVTVIDAATNATIATIAVGPDASYNGVIGVAVSPDGKNLYATAITMVLRFSPPCM